MRPPRRSAALLAGGIAAAVASPASAADPEGLHVGVRASGGADVASLPAPTAGAEVAVVLIAGANRFEAFGAAWIPQAATAPRDPSAGLLISLVTGGARYCRAFIQRALELGGCAGFEGGAMLARSFGTSTPATATGPWAAPSLGLAGRWSASSSFSFSLAVEGVVPVVRPAFELAGLGEVHRTAPATGRALLGVEARFR